jgi:adenylate kinase
MRLVLLGPPGSGKGTQAKLLSQRLGLRHIGTGDMLREAIHLDTPTGRLARPYVEGGGLVPDELINQLVKDCFGGAARPEQFVMDGYPRTVPQATAFDAVLRDARLPLDAVVHLVVDDEEIVRRLSGRWICPNKECGATYHTTFKPPRVSGVCDDCGSKLIQREDDKEATVRKRLQIYHQNTAGLLAHYKAQGLLREAAGEGAIEAVYANIAKVI